MAKPLPNVHINGFPGTGKLTIARELAARLNSHYDNLTSKSTHQDQPAQQQPAPKTSNLARIIHNHLLIDPANALLQRTQPGYQTLRKALRQAVFTTLAHESSTYPSLYIFTDWQSGDALGSQVCEEVARMATARGSELIPVIIKCAEQENLRRLASPEREKFGGKITDGGLFLRFRREERSSPSVFGFEGHVNRIEVDVTEWSVEEAAGIIFAHVVQFVSDGKGDVEE